MQPIVTIEILSHTSARAFWPAVPGAYAYDVEIADANNPASRTLVGTTAATEFVFPTLTSGTTYSVWVTANVTSEPATMVIPQEPVPPPTNVRLFDATVNSISLGWGPCGAPYEVVYVAEYSLDRNYVGSYIATFGSQPVIHQIVLPNPESVHVYARVRAERPGVGVSPWVEAGSTLGA